MEKYISFQQFSDLLNASVLILLTINIIAGIIYVLSRKYRNYLSQFSYQFWIGLIAVLLAAGIVGANMYEYVYNDPPCMFCWYQRVVIYPMFMIALIELYKKFRTTHVFISVFAFLTLLISTYHYSFHFRRYVLGQGLSMPCSTNPLVASCESAKVVSFGFATMPMMSVITSIAILSICFVLYKKSNTK